MHITLSSQWESTMGRLSRFVSLLFIILILEQNHTILNSFQVAKQFYHQECSIHLLSEEVVGKAVIIVLCIFI